MTQNNYWLESKCGVKILKEDVEHDFQIVNESHLDGMKYEFVPRSPEEEKMAIEWDKKYNEHTLPPFEPKDTATAKEIIQKWENCMAEMKKDDQKKTLPKLKKIMVFYIDIGQMSNKRAETYIQNIKDELKNTVDRLPVTTEHVFLPVRNQPSKIEVLDLE